MAFKFSWPDFDEEFYDKAIAQLEQALNKGNKPPHICSDILVSELFLGTKPPALEILEISDMTLEKFKGIFRFTYAGDAFIDLQTKVQVNPVTPSHDVPIPFQSRMLSAHKPLVVPMQIRICDFIMDAIFYLSISSTKGISLTFKNDPIQQVYVQSTFDELPSVRDMLQTEIEKQLRDVLNEEMPRVLHAYSMRWATDKEEDIEHVLGVPKRDEDIALSIDSGLGESLEEMRDSLEHVANLRTTPSILGLAHDMRPRALRPRPTGVFPFASELRVNTAASVCSYASAPLSAPVRSTETSPMRTSRKSFNSVLNEIQRESPPAFRRIRRRQVSNASAPLTPFVGLHPQNLKTEPKPVPHVRVRTNNTDVV